MQDEYGLDYESILDKAPLGIIYGRAKIGKSTACAVALNDSLFFTHDDQVLRPYESYIAALEAKFPGKREELGLRPIGRPYDAGGFAKKVFPMFWEGRAQTPMQTNTLDPLREWIMETYAPKMKRGDWPFGGLVFDEWSTIVGRAYRDIMDANLKKGSGGAVFYDYSVISPQIRNFHTEVANVATYTSKPIFLVMHEVEPKYFPPDDRHKPNQLEQRGGPNFPLRKVITDMCATASFILRVRAEEKKVKVSLGGQTTDMKIDDDAPWSPSGIMNSKLERWFVTEPTDEWEGGVRDFRVDPREKLDLRGLLTRIGFLKSA